MSKALPFPGTSRFEVRKCLGAGGFGTVYEALDRKRSALVALKVLRQASPEDLYRFKQEFRSLSGISHRNLVTLYELCTEEERWFFSMELVQGTDFISHLWTAGVKQASRAAPAADDSTASFGATLVSAEGQGALATGGAPLRSSGHRLVVSVPLPVIAVEQLLHSLQQLAEGLLFLHDQGFVHRDIKPANVLCTPLGRVVLLDFGLAQEITSGTALSEPAEAGIAGTPDYMSPEQVLSQNATAAADWYSVGVLLYETLTGRVPFSGTVSQVLRQKVSQAPPPLSLPAGSSVPEELQALCLRLLQRQPEQRPSGSEVVTLLRELATRLGVTGGAAEGVAAGLELRAGPPRGEARFIGRQEQQQALAAAFAASRQGKTVVALCRGESGAGKSALCKHFLKELVAREPALVVLSGRCYAHEDVPFKALDGVVDALSRFLRHRPRAELHELLPRDIPAVARLFPVLLQVGAIKEAPPRRIADDLQVKQVASLALRELVLRLSAQRPVVLYIDDLQWGDRDGIQLLLELLRPPDSPRLLLIVAYRSDEEHSSAALEVLRSGLAGDLERSVAITEVSLDGLSAPEADALARQLLPEAAKERAAVIATDSGGNPFFVRELSRFYWAEPGASPPGGSLLPRPSMLDGLIRARAERLPLASRQLLSSVAVAGQPISRAATALAYAEAEGTDEPQALALLRAEHLVRVRHTQGGADGAAPREELLVYHDRIREAIVAGLRPEEQSALHLRLAQALKVCGHGEPEQMVFHLQHGGDLGGAAHYAVQASAQAYSALAYHQAVRLCRAALLTGKLAAADQSIVKARLADALVGAGHPKQAAEIYLELAEHAPTESAFNRRRQAAKQLFISGHIKEGYKVIEELLPAARLTIPKTAAGRLASLLVYQLLVAAHGTEFRERTEAEIPTAELLRIDTCEAISSTTAVDPLLAANFATQFLWYALRAGEPRRIVVALTAAAGLMFAFGAAPARIEQILGRAESVAERLQYSYGIGRGIFIRGHIAYLMGKWQTALTWLHRANEILKSDCVEATAIIDYSGTVELLCLRGMGHLRKLAEKFQPYLKDAVERGRKSHELTVRLSSGFLLLLRDDTPDRAAAFVQAAQLRLGADVSLTYLFGIEAQLLVLLYQGQVEEAWRLFSANRPKIERSGLLRMDLFMTMWRSLGVTLLLATCRPLRLVEVELARLLQGRCVFARPLATLHRAVVRRRQGRLWESSWLIREAEAGLAACDMHLHAACVRFRRGTWLGGAEGEELVRLASEWMAGQGIRNPERMAAMIVPS